jgi:hypothetical protein
MTDVALVTSSLVVAQPGRYGRGGFLEITEFGVVERCSVVARLPEPGRVVVAVGEGGRVERGVLEHPVDCLAWCGAQILVPDEQCRLPDERVAVGQVEYMAAWRYR